MFTNDIILTKEIHHGIVTMPKCHQWPARHGGGGAGGACTCVVLESPESCCLMTWSFIKWGSRPSEPLAIHEHPPPPFQQCGSARPFRAGISTLISHLWRSNELRLLIHLWDPADYQTGRPTICQRQRVAFMLLTLLPRRAETKQGQRREDAKMEWKPSGSYSLCCYLYCFR